MGGHQGKSITARAKAFDQLERLWADPRFTTLHGGYARDLRATITVWLLLRARGERITWAGLYERVTTNRPRADLGYWARGILQADLPRYAPPEDRGRRCHVPKTRGPNTGKPCGRSWAVGSRVTDPATGEWQVLGWCRDHAPLQRAAAAREAQLTAVPEPLPNTGGLLPSYLPDYDWASMYAKVDERWREPFVGIVADDWPVLAKTHTPPVGRPVLELVPDTPEHPAVNATLLGDTTRPEPPTLRLVTTTDTQG
jgi:hypothetical protein